MSFQSVSEMFLKGDIQSESDFHSLAFTTFAKTFTSRLGVSDITALLKNGKEDFLAHVKAYDTMGNEIEGLWDH